MAQAPDPAELSDRDLARFVREASDEELGAILEEQLPALSVAERFALLARLVDAMSDDQLRALTGGSLRERVLDEIFAGMAGQFREDEAGDLDAAVHWKIFDRPGGGYDHYELVIDDGRCSLSDVPEDDPRVTFRMKPEHFLKLVTGKEGPTKMALRGRLQVVGDVGFARKVNGLFALPDA